MQNPIPKVTKAKMDESVVENLTSKRLWVQTIVLQKNELEDMTITDTYVANIIAYK
jgi:hypothetical protein